MRKATPQINQTLCTIRTIRYCQPEEPCDRCGNLALKYSTTRRTAIDLDMSHPVLLDVQVSVHHCVSCHHYFRIQPPFLRRDGIYTGRVIQKAVEAVVQDGMAYRRVTNRMARDFWVQPSEGSVRRWCRSYGEAFRFDGDYQEWAVSEFSGILCIDEVYQNKLALLLAVDPATSDGDRLIGYQLHHGSVTAEDVKAFTDNLKAVGIEPEQVITDGSSLYPTVLKEVWSKAAHQLCLFHETRHITKAALKAINNIRRQIPVVTASDNPSWHGGPITKSPPVEEQANPATRRWYWRQWQRYHRIKHVHELAKQRMSQRAIARQTGHHRKTVRKWLQQPIPSPPVNLPKDIEEAEMIWPEKQQRKIDKQNRMKQVHYFASQGHNHSEIGRLVGIHRITVKKWLQQKLPETAVSPSNSSKLKIEPPAGWKSVQEVSRVREMLRKHRFLFVRHYEGLSEEEKTSVDELLASSIGDQLQTIHSFVQDWYRIWKEKDGQRQTHEVAKNNYQEWRQNAKFQAVPALNRVITQMTNERFGKIAHFLNHPHWEATNNGAERMGRSYRHRQSSHYNLRKPETISTMITVDAYLKMEKAINVPAQRFHYCQRGRKSQ